MTFFPADDEQGLAVGFEADQAIDHVDARLLHLLGPGDVVGLVFFPFGGKTVLGPVDGGGGPVQWAKKRWSRPW